MKDKKDIENELKNITHKLNQQKNIVVGYLYGSYATGDATSKSDIDIGVVLGPNKANVLLEESRLNEDLNDNSEFVVQVSVLNEKSPFFRYKAIGPRHILFSKDEGFRADFEVGTLNQYFDMQNFYEENYQSAVKLAKTNDR